MRMEIARVVNFPLEQRSPFTLMRCARMDEKEEVIQISEKSSSSTQHTINHDEMGDSPGKTTTFLLLYR